ncbi:MAG: hypothetical protein PHH13_03620 [Candidatus Peribacteraceae bacterium]|nr:hypothetical protein [Candidatus Peribacteraceae bacterium]
MSSPKEDHQSDVSSSPHLHGVGKPRLRISASGEVQGSMAGVRQQLERVIPQLAQLPDGETPLSVDLPSMTLEVAHPQMSGVMDVLRDVERVSLRVTMAGGELTALRILAARPSEGGIRSFSGSAQQSSEAAGSVTIEDLKKMSGQAAGALAARRQRGKIGQFLHRIGRVIGLESSLREEEGEHQLSGEVEGGKHIPTAAELARKFLSTGTTGGGERETSLGFRTRYLRQLMEVVPGEAQKCVRAADAKGLETLAKSLGEVAAHPAFSTVMEVLTKGGGGEGAPHRRGFSGEGMGDPSICNG